MAGQLQGKVCSLSLGMQDTLMFMHVASWQWMLDLEVGYLK